MKRLLCLILVMLLLLTGCKNEEPPEPSLWEKQYELGMSLKKTDPEQAAHAFEAAAIVNPGPEQTYLQLAEVYEALDDTQAAIKALQWGMENANTTTQLDKMLQSLQPAEEEASGPWAQIKPMELLGKTPEDVPESWGGEVDAVGYSGSMCVMFECGEAVLVGVSEQKGIITHVMIKQDVQIVDGVRAKLTYPEIEALAHERGMDVPELQQLPHEGEQRCVFTCDGVQIQYGWMLTSDPQTRPAEFTIVGAEP